MDMRLMIVVAVLAAAGCGTQQQRPDVVHAAELPDCDGPHLSYQNEFHCTRRPLWRSVLPDCSREVHAYCGR